MSTCFARCRWRIQTLDRWSCSPKPRRAAGPRPVAAASAAASPTPRLAPRPWIRNGGAYPAGRSLATQSAGYPAPGRRRSAQAPRLDGRPLPRQVRSAPSTTRADGGGYPDPVPVDAGSGSLDPQQHRTAGWNSRARLPERACRQHQIRTARPPPDLRRPHAAPDPGDPGKPPGAADGLPAGSGGISRHAEKGQIGSVALWQMSSTASRLRGGGCTTPATAGCRIIVPATATNEAQRLN
jgi:hypothetical protein